MRSLIQRKNLTWVEILDPTLEDIEFLAKEYQFHPMVLDELTVRSYHPRIEIKPSYVFLTINYPVYHQENREIRPRELDIIITKEVLVTSHFKSIPPLEELFKECQASKEAQQNYLSGTGYLLFHILDRFWRDCLKKMSQPDQEIEKVERKIFEGKEKELVREISLIKTDIIDLWRIVEPHEEVMEILERDGPKFFGEELSLYFSDVFGTYQRAWHTLRTFRETILALEDTNQSLLTTKTNETIRILTVFSVILLPLTLLASIWGMNTAYLPFAQTPGGFWVIVALMIFLMGLMIVFFKKKKWL